MPYANESNDDCSKRLADKYHGVKICDMNSDELDEFLTGIAQRGAADALKAVGLSDIGAVTDIKDLRDLLQGFRVVKKNVIMSTLSGVGRILGWALVVTLAGYFVGHSNEAKTFIKLLGE